MTTPADIIRDELIVTEPDPPFTRRLVADGIIAALDAAGFDIVARQPDTCPTCGSDDPEARRIWTSDHAYDICPDAWHDRGRR